MSQFNGAYGLRRGWPRRKPVAGSWYRASAESWWDHADRSEAGPVVGLTGVVCRLRAVTTNLHRR